MYKKYEHYATYATSYNTQNIEDAIKFISKPENKILTIFANKSIKDPVCFLFNIMLIEVDKLYKKITNKPYPRGVPKCNEKEKVEAMFNDFICYPKKYQRKEK